MTQQPMCTTQKHSWHRVFYSFSRRAGNPVTWLMGLCLLVSATLASAAPSWNSAASLQTARYRHTSTLLPNGKVLVAGGYGNGSDLASAELYDPATDAWTLVGALPTARFAHTATLTLNGKVLVAGGFGNGSFPASAQMYDPATNAWTAAGSLATARYQHTSTLLPNGKVLVAGGYGNAGTSNLALASAEMYDPATNAWTAAGSLATGRYSHTATLLPNGKVLLAGGVGNGGLPASAELYDPATNAWAAAGAPATARYSHTATLLPNGKVLLAGGVGNGSDLASAELYDPATNAWTSADILATARSSHRATLLLNGKVLVAGGFGNGSDLASAELYDPATNAWTSADILATARSSHTATLLLNGKVLVAGGFGNSSALASAELFSAPFTIDTTTAPMSGLWWNQNESGWGVSIEQQGPIMFIGWYTYLPSGASTRYFMSNCGVSGNSCSGSIYSIADGAAPTAPWIGHGPATTVGSGTLTFSDNNTGVFNFVLNGVAGSKNIVRNVFGTTVVPSAIDYTALWWNPSESGWGVFLAHQSPTMFAVLFTYDAQGNPMRYVASNCAVSGNGNGCTGTLYKTSGGSVPTVPWVGPMVGPITLTPVGTITFTFANASNGTMSFTIDGAAGSKAISKMIFYTPPA